jgi:hypothetical protein
MIIVNMEINACSAEEGLVNLQGQILHMEWLYLTLHDKAMLTFVHMAREMWKELEITVAWGNVSALYKCKIQLLCVAPLKL